MERFFAVSNHSEIMAINDCEIESKEGYHQDMNIMIIKSELEEFFRERNKSSQLSDGDYKML